MANTERLYKIERLIRVRGVVGFQALRDELEVSPATLKRDLEYLRSRLGAPIEYDREANGYRLGVQAAGAPGQRYELPGLWFDESELYSLLMAHQLLAGLDEEGLLARHLQPLLERIHQLLGSGDGSAAGAALQQRVRVVSALKRPVPSRFFQRVAEALLQRRRLHLRYLTRGRRESGERDVSPQRLVHYRSTWYLDAWCHRVEGLRRFALDAIEDAVVLEQKARELPLAEVARNMDAGYGIYAGGGSGASGKDRRWATLRFDRTAAQWAGREQWHPEQQGRWLGDGRYELRVPYVEETELVMDILRQGEQVEVLEPAALRRSVRARLEAAVALYRP
ncbi:MAG: WYL domain-containing protein [Burkholderiales bacterium]|nr:WYL domain-containing protein [Burkholderiales bacterium]